MEKKMETKKGLGFRVQVRDDRVRMLYRVS